VKSLETKKQDVAQLSGKLFDLKAALSDRLDVPEFTQMIVTEAKRVGLSVQSIRPLKRTDTEFYREFPFELKFRGVFPQIYTFVSRVAALQKLVRIDKFSLAPVSSNTSKFVELEGELELKTFAYLGSQADAIADKSTAPDKKGGQ
jgi:Tfp pilus assembly protein PilO